MLIILNDPAGVTGRTRHALDYGVSLQTNIERHLSGGADAELRINGQVVDPLTDPRLDMAPGRGDLVAIALRPRGFDPITWAYIAVAAAVAYTVIALRNIPSFDTASGKDSPNNKLTAQSNVARAYQAIPDVYGYRRVWPDLIQPSTVEYVDHLKYVTEWLCISRGLGTITSVQYAETPIGDIDGSSFEVFEPEPVSGYAEFAPTTLNDVYETFASDEVNGQELPYAESFVELEKSGTFTAVNGATTFTVTIPNSGDLADLKTLAPSGTAVVSFQYSSGPPIVFTQTCTVLSYLVSGPNVTFTFGSAVWLADWTAVASTFTINPNGSSYTTSGPYTLPLDCGQIWWNTVFLRGLQDTVVIRAEWWKIDIDGVEVPGTRQTEDNTYSDSTYDQRFYTDKVTPSGGFGRYRIQFQRRTVQVDDGGADVAKLEDVYAVRHYQTKELTGVTVLRVTTKATLAATGFSDRKFNLRWSRHVRTLTSDTISPSRNFARALAHIWTIAGNSITGLDTSTLQTINTQHGETSPLLRFDGSLDDADMSLGERMQFVADSARCVIWRDGTKWTATRDQAKQYPELQFDYRNLAASGDSAIAYASHLPASNDGVEVEYVDEVSQSKKAYARLNISTGVPLAGAARNPKKIKMLGCATQAQADNRAQLEARRLIYQRVSVSDTALSDASGLGLLSLVRWVDPNDFGGDDMQAGEVMSRSGLIITTSEAIDWKGETSGRIMFTGIDGRRLGAPIQCYPATGGAVELASLPDGLYLADADRQCGSRYLFDVGITSDELEAAGLYLVTEVKPAGDGTVSIALAQYDARTYGADAPLFGGEVEEPVTYVAGDISLDGAGTLEIDAGYLTLT